MSPRLKNPLGHFALTIALLSIAEISPVLSQAVVVQATQDAKAEIQRLNQDGERLSKQGQYEKSLEILQKALKLARSIGDRPEEAKALTHIASVYRAQEQYPKALEHLQQALQIYRDRGDRANQGQILQDLSYVYPAVNQTNRAITAAREALAINREFQKQRPSNAAIFEEIIILSQLGQLLEGDNRRQEAISSYQQAIAASEKWDDREYQIHGFTRAKYQGLLRKALGRVYSDLQHYPQAIEQLEIAQQVTESIANERLKQGISQSLINNYTILGYQYRDQGNFDKAMAAYQQGLKVAQAAKAPELEARVWQGISSLYSKKQEFAKAIPPRQRALALARQAKDPDLEALNLYSLGSTYADLSQFPKALEVYQQALTIYQKSQQLSGVASVLNNIGLVYSAQGQYRQAYQAHSQALKILQAISQRYQKPITRENLDVACANPDQFAEGGALEFLRFQCSEVGANQRYSKQFLDYLNSTRKSEATTIRNLQGNTINNLGVVAENLGDYAGARNLYEQALTIAKELKNPQVEAERLNNIGNLYATRGQFPQALATLQQALEIAKSQNARALTLTVLNNIASIYSTQGQVRKSIENKQQALALAQEIDNGFSKANQLNNLGVDYGALGNYPKALELFQQALKLAQKIGVKPLESITLGNIASLYSNQGQYAKALQSYQQALQIVQATESPSGEASIRTGISFVYSLQGRYREALAQIELALTIQRKIGDRASVANSLNNIGVDYQNLGDYTKALDYLQQALAIAKELGIKSLEGKTLENLARLYQDRGEYKQAIATYEQALSNAKAIESLDGEATTYNGIADVYAAQTQYAKALAQQQQALAIFRKIGNPLHEALLLSNIGHTYSNLGQASQSLNYQNQALKIAKAIGARKLEAGIYLGIAYAHWWQKQYDKSVQSSQQALTIYQQIGNRTGESNALRFLGASYRQLNQFDRAKVAFEQALTIAREINLPPIEAQTLRGLGNLQTQQNQFAEAQVSLQRALSIAQQTGNRDVIASTFSDLGDLTAKQNHPELAILFYKQSVNNYEAIRKDLRSLSQEQQASYTETVAETYRTLADLLLKNDRILEAQQVLDLLKVQELDDYLRNVRGNPKTQQGIDYLPPEQQLLAKYNAQLTQVFQLGKELDKLQNIPRNQRTPQQEQRRQEIEGAQRELLREYLNFIRSPQIVALVQQLARTTGGENLNPQLLRGLQDNLKKLAQDAVLLYPLILDDRLELVLLNPYAPPIHRSVPIKREDLNRTIADFRSALTNPSSNAKKPAQKLYNWLIEPIEAALKEANAQTIIYAPDGQLRYIPLAALYDGNQWLVQKYRVNNITALSLTEWDKQAQAPKILAGAFTEGNYSFPLGDRSFNFKGLPFAGKEVENLVATVPGTTGLINRNFSEDETVARMSDYSILHFATHAAFVTGNPENSFILFGNGDRANFRDVEVWPLTNTDLVVLSACETGVGGKLGNGEEILGFGYLMQQAGARAAIASLWTIDDGGTQALMNAFYATLESGNTTKAEALRQAQIALITSDYTALGQERGITVERIRDSLPPNVSDRLNHPYYWSPFILIGNGL